MRKLFTPRRTLAAAFVSFLLQIPGTAGAVTLQQGDIVVAAALGFTAPNFCFGAVVAVDPQSGAQAVVTENEGNLCRPSGVALEADGTAYVSGSDPNLPGSKIVRIENGTGARTTVTSQGNLNAPKRLALDGLGNILVADINAGDVIRVDLFSGAQTVLATGGFLDAPNGIDVAPNGDIFVADFNPSGVGFVGDVVKINPVTGAQTLVTTTGSLPTPVDLAVGPDGLIYVATSFGVGLEQVYRFDPVTGAEELVYTAPGNLQNLEGIAFEADGSLLVSISNQIRRVDVSDGSDVLVAQDGDLRALGQLAVVPAALPEPAALWLLAFGLLLARAARRGSA